MNRRPLRKLKNWAFLGLSMLATLAGLLAAYESGRAIWLLGAALMLAPWPYTLIVIMATNRALHATAIDSAGPETRRLIEKWGRLHAVRTAFGMAGSLAYLWALNA